MDFEFSEEEKLLKEDIHEFLAKKLRPIMKNIDQEEKIPRDFVREAGKMGIWGTIFSKDVGGLQLPMTSAVVIAEELGWADFSLATGVMYVLEEGWGYVLDKLGNNDLRQEVLPKVIEGEHFLGVASTEPTGGSDVASIRTQAIREGDHYVISGQKVYISGALEAKEWGGGHLVLTKTNPKEKHKGISIIYVPATLDNVRVSKINNMGRMGISTAIVSYDNVEVPLRNLVGEENRGFYHAMEGFNHARVLVAGICLGAARAILDQGIEYIKNREAFGQKLKDFQAIAFEASELYTRLEMARLLTYKAAWAIDKGLRDAHIIVAMAKLTSPQTALDIAKSVMMWMGGYGYSKDAMIEAGFRGIVSYLVGAEGAMNIMKLIISRGILG
ncbi:acyl-CoA dehydrogenase family protein [Stygiolobus caldivivus]|uniref:Acyl-CoA dehydrogenase n=1 Tax=Stygiolobus caldivivus TaxID=2824673 RepID=A0A8D5ZK86_9CREN|nr:acyl-CoA dehydrogenase family protein [Stygiolobus caldivivus]BCU71476.1 acyl-CoA dehydrogenase [Stygiolobus caldivivus]